MPSMQWDSLWRIQSVEKSCTVYSLTSRRPSIGSLRRRYETVCGWRVQQRTTAILQDMYKTRLHNLGAQQVQKRDWNTSGSTSWIITQHIPASHDKGLLNRWCTKGVTSGYHVCRLCNLHQEQTESGAKVGTMNKNIWKEEVWKQKHQK